MASYAIQKTFSRESLLLNSQQTCFFLVLMKQFLSFIQLNWSGLKRSVINCSVLSQSQEEVQDSFPLLKGL